MRQIYRSKTTQAARVLVKFSPTSEPTNGVRFLAAALGHKHPTTVRSWLNAGKIPHERWAEILTCSSQFVTRNDFGNLVRPTDYIAHLSEAKYVRETWPDLLEAA